MTLWIDADACPVVIRDIMVRAAERTRQPLVLVANQIIRIPPSPLIRRVQVDNTPDAADHWIAEHAEAGDLVITADIPLAARLVPNQVSVLTPRGEALTANIIGERLSVRDFMDGLRSAGIQTGGPAPMSTAEQREFARHLDRFLASQPKP